MSLRTPQMEAQYQADKAHGNTQPLDKVPSKREFSHWRIIPNKYPYAHYLHHDLLVPKQKVATLKELSPKARIELFKLISVDLVDDYDCILINFPHTMTIKNHFHVHLGVLKEHL